MKKVNSLIAIVALVGVLGVGNSFGSESAKSVCSNNTDPSQCSETTRSWLDEFYSYVEGLFKSGSGTNAKKVKEDEVMRTGINLAQHNETLVRDEM